MYNLIRYLVRYHLTIAFIILEATAIILIAHTSSFRNTLMLANVDAVKGTAGNITGSVARYFMLRNENDRLINENAELKNRIDMLTSTLETFTDTIPDSPLRSFVHTPAKVVINSLNRRNNYLILNVGSRHGIVRDMGVISADGIAGVVDRVAENYCTVISLLTSRRSFDARLKSTGHHGPMVWDGKDINHIDIVNIPHHIHLALGDSVLTSGYSMTFPEGIFIGTVSSFEIERGTSYRIKVRLSNDFQTLDRVYVVKSLKKSGLDSLENSSDI
jgi:rod shape-determining protein MreC